MSIPLFVSERPKPEITTRPLSVGCLIFERTDHIDFTGPFEVLSRMPVRVVAKEPAPVAVDGNLVTAAGVTAGLDAALVLVSLSFHGSHRDSRASLRKDCDQTPDKQFHDAVVAHDGATLSS